jgi:F0F1-type ATP synthase membrane subunit b/b'
MIVSNARRVVYTTLFGGYEQLNDGQAASPSIPFICFTDDPGLTSDRWEIRLVTPEFPFDLIRSQRIIKFRGHEALDGFDETLYIDNSVSLRSDANTLLDEWLANADVAIPLHSFRRSVAAEFAEVVATGLDDAQRVYEQFDHYAATQPEVLDARPLWSGMIARRPTPQVRAAFLHWLDQVLRYSRRDQLSARVAFATSGITLHEIEIDNQVSPWHEWPVNLERDTTRRFAAGVMRVPDLLRVARLETQLEEARRVGAEQLEEARRVGAEQLEEARRVGAEQLEEARRVGAEQLEEARDEIAALLGSRSWRVTAPLRRLSSGVRRS